MRKKAKTPATGQLLVHTDMLTGSSMSFTTPQTPGTTTQYLQLHAGGNHDGPKGEGVRADGGDHDGGDVGVNHGSPRCHSVCCTSCRRGNDEA